MNPELILGYLCGAGGCSTRTCLGRPMGQPAAPVQADDDPSWYPKGVKITDAEPADVLLQPHHFHGEWNYTITPNQTWPEP